MAQGTNLSHELQSADSVSRRGVTPSALEYSRQGIRTQVLLVLAMALVTITVTALFLIFIQHRLRAQLTEDFSRDVRHSVVNFQNLQAERFSALNRENALLARLPPLKSLMTSGDPLTIQDGAVMFWQLSGEDLFALADSTGQVDAIYTSSGVATPALHRALESLITSGGKQYLVMGNTLYDCSFRPLYFGSDEDGTLLGYVISGNSIERTVRQISEPTGVEAAFVGDGRVLTSTLLNVAGTTLSSPQILASSPQSLTAVDIGGQRYLAATEDLSAAATSPLHLVLLKSFEPAEQSIRRIDRVVLSAGLLALIAGTLLMIALSRLLTRPLEGLSHSVRAFGMGDSAYRIPRHGTQEIRQLSSAFASMREEIQQTSSALLESERLATIGRMANSVSHDLRHYLAAIYANSEFLASDRLSSEERHEIFADIRAAVLGTTDMIESLLMFSRTGEALRRSPEIMATLLDRAMHLLRAHPDAEGVQIVVNAHGATGITVNVDAKQIERALYNLLLNACQAARASRETPRVVVELYCDGRYVVINIIDNGPGVPDNIRNSLFQPFVSEGKQKGTGLGLTLVQRIAQEHGGDIGLLRSDPGSTVFQMKLIPCPERDLSPERPDEVTAYDQ